MRRLLEGTGAKFTSAAAGVYEVQRAKDDTPAVTLESIVVSATRTARVLEDVPASVTVMNREQIRATPAQSVDDVIRTIPGVDLPGSAAYQQHPTSNSITMRGLGSGATRTLVMLDGVPLTARSRALCSGCKCRWRRSTVSKVVRGGGSALWGNYAALGGVVNFITRPPDATEVAADAGYGQYSTTRINAYGASTGNDSVKLSANLNYFNTGWVQPSPGGPTRAARRPDIVRSEERAGDRQLQGRSVADRASCAAISTKAIRLSAPRFRRTPHGWEDIAGGITKKASDTSAISSQRVSIATAHCRDRQSGRSVRCARRAPTSSCRTRTWESGRISALRCNGIRTISTLFPLLSVGADVHRVSGSDTADDLRRDRHADPHRRRQRQTVAGGRIRSGERLSGVGAEDPGQCPLRVLQKLRRLRRQSRRHRLRSPA